MRKKRAEDPIRDRETNGMSEKFRNVYTVIYGERQKCEQIISSLVGTESKLGVCFDVVVIE